MLRARITSAACWWRAIRSWAAELPTEPPVPVTPRLYDRSRGADRQRPPQEVEDLLDDLAASRRRVDGVKGARLS